MCAHLHLSYRDKVPPPDSWKFTSLHTLPFLCFMVGFYPHCTLGDGWCPISDSLPNMKGFSITQESALHFAPLPRVPPPSPPPAKPG